MGQGSPELALLRTFFLSPQKPHVVSLEFEMVSKRSEQSHGGRARDGRVRRLGTVRQDKTRHSGASANAVQSDCGLADSGGSPKGRGKKADSQRVRNHGAEREDLLHLMVMSRKNYVSGRWRQ